MKQTSKEQPWWRAHTDEIERKVASGEMNAATCFTKMLWLVSEASQAHRAPLSDAEAEDIAAECASGALLCDFVDAVRATERAHGIKD